MDLNANKKPRRQIRFVKASNYELPAVKPRRPYTWQDAWNDLYHAYLRSPVWRAKRTAAVHACNGLCSCGKPVDDVHHLTYDHVFNEPLHDLLAVCRACHQRLHGIDVESVG